MKEAFWLVGVTFAAQAMGAILPVTVRVNNVAGVREPVVQKALREAGWVLGKAGIAVCWEGLGRKTCESAPDYVLSIVGNDPRAEGSKEALGFAVLAGGMNGAAVIYPRIVERLKDRPQYVDCNLLSSVIAHELGHLLLRSAHHGEGIMKADWDDRDFEAMRHRRLLFSASQSQELRSSLVGVRHQSRGVSGTN